VLGWGWPACDASAGVVIEREATVGLPDERGWEPQVARSTEVCDGGRCRHTAETIGVFPALVVYVDLEAQAAWWYHPDSGTCAGLRHYAGVDRIWGVDLLEPLPFRPVTAARPAGLPADVTGWAVEKPGGIHVTVWVQPGLPMSAADFARRSAIRVGEGGDREAVAASLAALPGFPVEVRSGAPYRPGASTSVRVRVTRLAEIAVDPAEVTLPKCREITEDGMLLAQVTGRFPEPEPEPEPVDLALAEIWALRNTEAGRARRAADPDALFPGVGIGPVTLGSTSLREVVAALPPEQCRVVVARHGGRELPCSALKARDELRMVLTPALEYDASDGVIDALWTNGSPDAPSVRTASGVAVGMSVDEAVARMPAPPDLREGGYVRWDALGLELMLDEGDRVARLKSWAVEGEPPP
jgi:hypothetical protein